MSILSSGASRRLVLLLSGAGLLSLCGGCLSSYERSKEPYRPAMPTIAAAWPEANTTRAEHEIVAVAQQQARNGDLSGAVRTLFELRDGERRRGQMLALARELAAADPRKAEAFAQALPAGLTQVSVLELAAQAFVQHEADGALSWALQERDAQHGRVIRRAVAVELARVNARRAAEQLLTRPGTPQRDELLVLTASAWARRDPGAALEWVQNVSDGELKQRLISSVGFEIAQTNPNRAIEVAEMLPAGRNRWLLVGAAAQTWVAKDAKSAFAWANRLPAGEARDAAYAGFDAGLGVPSSRRIANAPGTRGGSSRTRGGGGAVAAVREGDTPTFAAWVAAQRPGMSREEAILEYVRQRGVAEPGAVGQWLTTLPPGPTRDRATEVYVENVLAHSPREAANFLRSLPRSDQTPEMLERTARRLLITDPAAAEAWIRDSALPEYRKQELLERR